MHLSMFKAFTKVEDALCNFIEPTECEKFESTGRDKKKYIHWDAVFAEANYETNSSTGRCITNHETIFEYPVQVIDRLKGLPTEAGPKVAEPTNYGCMAEIKNITSTLQPCFLATSKLSEDKICGIEDAWEVLQSSFEKQLIVGVATLGVAVLFMIPCCLCMRSTDGTAQPPETGKVVPETLEAGEAVPLVGQIQEIKEPPPRVLPGFCCRCGRF